MSYIRDKFIDKTSSIATEPNAKFVSNEDFPMLKSFL
jgi:hypothetical protein